MGRKYLGGPLAILLCSNAAAADWAVGINTVSWHSQPGYETFTPGVYVRGNGPLFGEMGVLRNSYGFTVDTQLVRTVTNISGLSHSHV